MNYDMQIPHSQIRPCNDYS